MREARNPQAGVAQERWSEYTALNGRRVLALPDLELAAGIRRVKGVRRLGVRLGNWLTADQGRRWQ